MNRTKQTTRNILLVRPANFGFNAETALSNAFQNTAAAVDTEDLSEEAIKEFDRFAELLNVKGVNVYVAQDTDEPIKPDAVFPNNWVSFHPDGTVVLYPMCTENRRIERRRDILDGLRDDFEINKIVDFSFYEKENKFLEGTGSIVFDHKKKTAYACISVRTNQEVFLALCKFIQYKPVFFYALDQQGKEIYHTNVMMCIAQGFTVICLESIADKDERAMVVNSLEKAGHEIVDISYEQMNNFAGNMLAVHTRNNKKLLVLSQSAYDSLTKKQKMQIEQYAELLPQEIKTIETIGGGSARCMMAELFLPERDIEN